MVNGGTRRVVAIGIVGVLLGVVGARAGGAAKPAKAGRRFHGFAVDARNEMPVTRSIRVLPGIEWDDRDGKHHVHWYERAEETFDLGRFDFTFPSLHQDTTLLRLCIRSPGFLPTRSKAYPHGAGDQELTLRLEPLPDPGGVVLKPDGTPAVGATVLLVVEGYTAMFRDGKLRGVLHSIKELPLAGSEATTDAEGGFGFPRQERAYMLVAFHESGYLETTARDLARSDTLRLQPWGRIDSTLFVLGQPATRQRLSLQSPRGFDHSLEGKGWYESGTSARHDWGVATDDQGRLVLERVPPGQIGTWWLWGEDHTMMIALHPYAAPLVVEAGKTLRVALGTASCVLTGRVTAAPGSGLQIDPARVTVSIFRKPPSVSGPDDLVQQDYEVYGAFVRSDVGKAYSHDVQGVGADGTFRIEPVLPGRHFIQVRLRDRTVPPGEKAATLIGWYVRRFSVDLAPVPLRDGKPVPPAVRPTINLGELPLRPPR